LRDQRKKRTRYGQSASQGYSPELRHNVPFFLTDFTTNTIAVIMLPW